MVYLHPLYNDAYILDVGTNGKCCEFGSCKFECGNVIFSVLDMFQYVSHV